MSLKNGNVPETHRAPRNPLVETIGEPWQLLDECDEALLILDNAFGIAYANERAASFSPLPVAQMVGRSASELFPLVFASVFGIEIRAAIEERERRSLTAPCPMTGMMLRFRAVPVGNDWLAMFLRYADTPLLPTPLPDVAPNTPQSIESSCGELVNLAADWVFEVDTNLAYTYVSPSIAGTLGYEPHEIIGKTPFDLVTEEYAAIVAPMFRTITATQTTYSGLECAYYSKTGETVYQECSGAPIYDTRGKWAGYRGVKRNVTAQKKREAVLTEIARKQSEIAETLQNSLLQTPPRVALPHVEVVTRYKPASSDALIGGDLFDVYPLHDNKIAFVVGDIAGKGLSAATDMAEIKFLLRSYLRESSNPEAALVRLNRQLFLRHSLQENRDPVLVCLSVAVLDTVTGAVRFAVAGMEPPLVIRAASESRETLLEPVTVGGFPLGALTSWQMDEGDAMVCLERGDLFLLYTDGVVEARSRKIGNPMGDLTGNPNDPIFGATRLVHAVRESAYATLSAMPPRPVAVICDAVLSAVQDFTGDERRDDICLLLTRYLPDTAPSGCSPMPAVPNTTDTTISRLDSAWRYTFLTENIEAFTGQKRSELLGKTLWEAFPAFTGTNFERMVRRARTENRQLVADMELIPPGVLYRVSATPTPEDGLEVRTFCMPTEQTSDLSRALEIALREREIALRESEAALREREAALRENEKGRDFQRRFLTEVLFNVTEGRLRLCSAASDLPALLSVLAAPIALESSVSLAGLRRGVEDAAATVGLPPDRVREFVVSVGEAGMNAVVHGGGGAATLYGDPATGQLQVCITDTGAGIAVENLHRATLERGYTTAGSLGLGFSLIYSAADRVFLLTGATGTTLLLEQHRESAGARDLWF